MKKIVLAIVCFVFYAFLSGCATDRKVIGNTFQSDYPKLTIQIDPEFKYLEKIDKVSIQPSIDQSRQLQYHEEFYFFVSDVKEYKINKALYIHVGRIETFYHDTTIENKKNLDFGVLKYDGYNFKYYKRIVRPGTDSDSTKYYMDAGYSFPSCFLSNALYIIPYNDLKITIYYGEDATPSGMTCDNKYSINTLSDEQKEYLKAFHNRALAAIGFGNTTKK